MFFAGKSAITATLWQIMHISLLLIQLPLVGQKIVLPICCEIGKHNNYTLIKKQNNNGCNISMFKDILPMMSR